MRPLKGTISISYKDKTITYNGVIHHVTRFYNERVLLPHRHVTNITQAEYDALSEYYTLLFKV